MENKCIFCSCVISDGLKFCSRSCKAKWQHKYKPFSKFVKGHKTRVGMKQPPSFYEKFSGAVHPSWKGEDTKYAGVHNWVRKHYAKTGVCESCKVERKTAWSNKDHLYRRNRGDWQEMCYGCHQKYDMAHGLRSNEGQFTTGKKGTRIGKEAILETQVKYNLRQPVLESSQ